MNLDECKVGMRVDTNLGPANVVSVQEDFALLMGPFGIFTIKLDPLPWQEILEATLDAFAKAK